MVAIMDVSMDPARAFGDLDELDNLEELEAGLVIEDDTPVDSIYCEKQQRLLTEPLYSSWSGPPPSDAVKGPRPFAALSNVGLFWSPKEPPVVPDMMLSLDVALPQDFTQKKNRSYFVWRLGKVPDVVIEVVSNREGDELGERFRRYRRMQVAYYVVYDPLHELGAPTLRTFEMRGGQYVPIERPWFEPVGLGLVEWDGLYEGFPATWLRWCTRDGIVLPTGAERAQALKLRAQASEARVQVSEARAQAYASRALTAEERAQRLEAKLRALGIDPNGDE